MLLTTQNDCVIIYKMDNESKYYKWKGIVTVKKIGHETLFIKTNENRCRCGESTFIRLADGRILFAFTDYYGDDREDHGTARISACVSCDEGETWSEPHVLIPKDPEAQNIMSPALVRMANGNIGILYLRKLIMPDHGIICMPYFRQSSDEGGTWSEQKRCSIPDGYYCGINDGAIVTASGRILWPISYHGNRQDPTGNCTVKIEPKNEIHVLYSDDNGETWAELPGIVTSPFASTSGYFAEPGIYEQEDGTLWMWFRTGLGHQYDTLSSDGGNTWLSPEPNLRFTSPDCPMRVKKFKTIAAAVFNPIPFHCLNDRTEVWRSPKRTPIVCAVSRDDATSFSRRGATFVNGRMDSFVCDVYLLEDDTTNSYCYPAMLETKDGFLVAYYHSDNTPYCLTASKITKVYRTEIE